MGFTLYDPSMNEIKYPVGVKPLDIFVSSIEKERISEKIDGIPGNINYGFNYKDREIKLTFVNEHYHDTHDYRLQRDDIYAMLDNYPFMYISDDKLPTRVLPITVDAQFTPERYGYWYSTIEVSGVISGLPFWKSKYTTQDIQTTGYNSLVDKYGTADGINVDYLKYTFTENTFEIWNGGNVTIDPRNMPLKIEFYNMATQGNFKIENLTTGDYHIHQSSFSGNHYILDGAIFRTASGTNKLRDTNRKYITLAPGLNQIKISNGTYDRAVFTFPFYYK